MSSALSANPTREHEHRDIRALLAMVSHDLRAPLRSIDGFALALEEDYARELEGQGLDYLARIRRAAQRMDRMLVTLVMLGRLTDRVPELERADISHIARDLAVALRERHADRPVRVEVDPGIMGVTDRDLIRIVIEELMGNAWKFTSGRSDAVIRVTRETAGPGRLAFAVRDNGDGFDLTGTDGKLFGLFQRFHPPDRFPGEGAGLATAHRVLRLLGGALSVETSPGAGAVFRCEIPEADLS